MGFLALHFPVADVDGAVLQYRCRHSVGHVTPVKGPCIISCLLAWLHDAVKLAGSSALLWRIFSPHLPFSIYGDYCMPVHCRYKVNSWYRKQESEQHKEEGKKPSQHPKAIKPQSTFQSSSMNQEEKTLKNRGQEQPNQHREATQPTLSTCCRAFAIQMLQPATGGVIFPFDTCSADGDGVLTAGNDLPGPCQVKGGSRGGGGCHVYTLKRR